MRDCYVIFMVVIAIIPTVSCEKPEKTPPSSVHVEQDENKNTSIEGCLESGHKPGTKDSVAYYIKFRNKRYYFMDEVPNLDSYKDQDLVVEGEFILKEFPGAFYMNKSDLSARKGVVPQGLMYTDKAKYEENKTYFQIMNPVIRVIEK